MLNQNLPKYVAVAEWIKQNIQNNTFKAGEKLISENQLCEKFSISRQTARQAIAILEKENLIIKKQGSGTYVNQFKSKRKAISKNIGILTTYIDDYIFPTIISGIEKVLSKHDYQMTLRSTHNKVQIERKQLLSLLDSDIDGLIVEGVKSALPNPNLDLYQEFRNRHIPIIFINSYYPHFTCNYIINDDIEAGRIATRHLIEQGHRKMAGIFKHDDLQGNLRYQGFLTELYEHQLDIDENCVIWYSTENKDQLFNSETFPHLLNQLKECSAIVCYNDQMAMKFIQLLTQANHKIPHDISLISFDNSSLSEMASVPLTSVTHPGDELGQLAMESILAMIENPHYEVKHVYPPSLIIRNSTQFLPKS